MESASGPSPKLRILLAEDGLVNQKLAIRMLQQRRHEVVAAKHGKEAVAAFEQQPFDLIFMDLEMPEMDGFEATAAIRAQEKNTGLHVPIVAMTAHSSAADQQRCLAAGMDGFLSKPIDPAELDRVLASPFSRPEPQKPSAAISPVSGSAVAPLAPLDWTAALKRASGKTRVVVSLAGTFMTECPTLMADLRGAVAREDADTLRRAAHTLKGSAGIFAAVPTVDAAAKLEEMGQQAEFSGAKAALAILEREVAAMLSALAAAVQNAAPVPANPASGA